MLIQFYSESEYKDFKKLNKVIDLKAEKFKKTLHLDWERKYNEKKYYEFLLQYNEKLGYHLEILNDYYRFMSSEYGIVDLKDNKEYRVETIYNEEEYNETYDKFVKLFNLTDDEIEKDELANALSAYVVCDDDGARIY